MKNKTKLIIGIVFIIISLYKPELWYPYNMPFAILGGAFTMDIILKIRD